MQAIAHNRKSDNRAFHPYDTTEWAASIEEIGDAWRNAQLVGWLMLAASSFGLGVVAVVIWFTGHNWGLW